MGLYDGIKDIAKVLQKADNIDLYSKLIDLSAQALDLQDEVSKLQMENKKLKEEQEIANDIERHESLFVTRKSDEARVKYCSRCWDSEHKLIQVDCYCNGRFRCPHCSSAGVDDKVKYKNGLLPSKGK
jgi:hypothetical protein